MIQRTHRGAAHNRRPEEIGLNRKIGKAGKFKRLLFSPAFLRNQQAVHPKRADLSGALADEVTTGDMQSGQRVDHGVFSLGQRPP